MACLMVVMLLVSVVPAVNAEGESGECGENLTWSFSAGTLTISGSGAMSDFLESTMAPWYSLRDQILRLELPQGLTAIGNLAFYGCDKLMIVNIPDSVTRIGSYAFAECEGMTMLSLGNSVAEIEECAFSDCVSLKSLRLPESLRTIGMKAFYRCESIPAVIIPAGVESIGMSAFAYCKSMVTADIRCNMPIVPEWMFYGCARLVSVILPDSTESISEFAFRGCDQLTTVYYDGSNKTPEQIQQIIDHDVPGFGSTGLVTDSSAPGSAISGATHENGDGTFVQENTTVTQWENTTVTTIVQTTHGEDGSGISTSVQIQVTVENDNGWDDAGETISNALKDFNENAVGVGNQSGKAEITVYVKDGEVPPEFVEIIQGRDVIMTIVTQDGSSWRIDGSSMNASGGQGQYSLRYSVTAGTAELCEELGVSRCYVLRFLSPAQVNAEVLIRLDYALAMQNATLLQKDKELKNIQSAVIDRQGCAHFYLASVTEETDYYIAINMPKAGESAIIPDELLPDYGNPERSAPIQYEITGRTSSWGMTFGQVTWIMAAVLVGCVIVIGFVMYGLNKRKLKRGYVPELDE